MLSRLFIILPILTGRLGITKITIRMRRKTHDTKTVSHPPNIDWQVRDKEDHHQYEKEDP